MVRGSWGDTLVLRFPKHQTFRGSNTWFHPALPQVSGAGSGPLFPPFPLTSSWTPGLCSALNLVPGPPGGDCTLLLLPAQNPVVILGPSDRQQRVCVCVCVCVCARARVPAGVLGSEGAEKYHKQQKGLRSKFCEPGLQHPTPGSPLSQAPSHASLRQHPTPHPLWMLPQVDPSSWAQPRTRLPSLLLLQPCSLPPLTSAPYPSREETMGRARSLSLTRAAGQAPPAPKLETEIWGGELASLTRAGEEVNHALEFSTEYLPLWFQGRALDLHNHNPFPWDFPRESAQSTPPEAQSRKDTGLQADRAESDLLCHLLVSQASI